MTKKTVKAGENLKAGDVVIIKGFLPWCKKAYKVPDLTEAVNIDGTLVMGGYGLGDSARTLNVPSPNFGNLDLSNVIGSIVVERVK